MPNEPEVDVLLMQYQDNTEHRRDHEQERSTANNVLVAAAAALIGAIVNGQVKRDQTGWAVAVVVIGLYGLFMTLKLTERADFHLARSQAIRKRLTEIVPTREAQHYMKEAEEKHRKQYPLLHNLRLWKLWTGLSVAIVLSGIVLSVVCWMRP
jgi:hypothetical protein